MTEKILKNFLAGIHQDPSPPNSIENSCYFVHIHRHGDEKNVTLKWWASVRASRRGLHWIGWREKTTFVKKGWLSAERTSTSAAQRISKVSSSPLCWKSAACTICIIYPWKTAQRCTLLVEEEHDLTNLCGNASTGSSAAPSRIIYLKRSLLIRKFRLHQKNAVCTTA